MKNFKLKLVLVILILLAISTKLYAFPWNYDMWIQPAIQPYQMPLIYPDKSVTTQGNTSHPEPREEKEAITSSPVPYSAKSVERGEEVFQIHCTVCHGPQGKGDGIIVTTGKGFYPVNLAAPATVQRTDGFIYAYIRYGGKVMMPSYRESITEVDAWNVVNYIRKLQKNTVAESSGLKTSDNLQNSASEEN